MKKRIHSLNKGKRVEREVAKLLSKLTGCVWERVPMSGAFSTTRKTQSCVFNGDLFCEEEPYKESLVVEVKATKELILLSDIFNPKSLLNKWIGQCMRESGDADWILIFKSNGRKPIILCKYEVFKPKTPSSLIIDSYYMQEKYSKLFLNLSCYVFGQFIIGEIK